MLTHNDKVNDLEKVVEGLDAFKSKINNLDYIHDKVVFFEVMKNFRRHLVEIEKKHSFDLLLQSNFFMYYKVFFTEVHEYYLRSVESMQALSIMTQGIHNYESFSDILDGEVLKESFDRKSKELSPFDFSKGGNFVFAGCGPFPETILYMRENTNIDHILGIDYNHEAVYMAGEMVRGLQFPNVSFQQIDATKFDYGNIDMVSIPLFVAMKSEVINRIIETGKDSVQIMVANPTKFLTLIYEELHEITPRAKITHREDFSSNFVTQEIIKIEKHHI